MTTTYTHDDHAAVEELLMGRTVEVLGPHLIRLDNGIELELPDTDGGCSCNAGCYDLKVLNRVDNIITKVEFVDSPDGLPEVPEGAVALVGTMTGNRWTREGDDWSCLTGPSAGTRRVQLASILLLEPVTVEMAPPREPRTWPKLDTLRDLAAVRGASGKVYRYAHHSASVPMFREYPGAPAHSFYAIQTFDGPLTEVFDDEAGTR